ncbi:MAG: hypothetical protein MZU95_00460 [Desulfomicrobium escambiense]|nr:hypothetical protein [Desulfomicrobium escambiense]
MKASLTDASPRSGVDREGRLSEGRDRARNVRRGGRLEAGAGRKEIRHRKYTKTFVYPRFMIFQGDPRVGVFLDMGDYLGRQSVFAGDRSPRTASSISISPSRRSSSSRRSVSKSTGIAHAVRLSGFA